MMEAVAAMDGAMIPAIDRKVVKSNDLIQRSRFSLNLQQQKIVLFLVSKIDPGDEDFKEYEFNISEFCRVCGIEATGGSMYADLRDSIKALADKSLWVDLGDGESVLCRWVEKARISKKRGKIKIRLDADLKPFLLQLKANFTRYELRWTLRFKSKYAVRLYELVASLHYHEMEEYQQIFSIGNLKKLMGAEIYDRYYDFRIRALEPAVREINRFSDKSVEYFPIKQGKSVERIAIRITTKGALQRLKLEAELNDELGLDQLRIWE